MIPFVRCNGAHAGRTCSDTEAGLGLRLDKSISSLGNPSGIRVWDIHHQHPIPGACQSTNSLHCPEDWGGTRKSCPLHVHFFFCKAYSNHLAWGTWFETEMEKCVCVCVCQKCAHAPLPPCCYVAVADCEPWDLQIQRNIGQSSSLHCKNINALCNLAACFRWPATRNFQHSVSHGTANGKDFPKSSIDTVALICWAWTGSHNLLSKTSINQRDDIIAWANRYHSETFLSHPLVKVYLLPFQQNMTCIVHPWRWKCHHLQLRFRGQINGQLHQFRHATA